MRYVALLLGVCATEAAEARYRRYDSSGSYSRSYYGSTYTSRTEITDERPPRFAAPDKPNLCDRRGSGGFEVVTGPSQDRGCFGSR